MRRETLMGRLRWGSAAAAFVLMLSGVLHVAGLAHDRRFAPLALFAVLAVALVAGLARRRPTMAHAATEADRRFAAQGLFAAACDVATLPPDRRPGAADLVLARAERLAAGLSSAVPAPTRRRSVAAQWAPLAAAVVGGVLLLFPGAGIAPHAPTASVAKTEPANPPALGSVIAALERVDDATPSAQNAPRAVGPGHSASPSTIAPAADKPGEAATGVPRPLEHASTLTVPSSADASATPGGEPNGSPSEAGGLAPGQAQRGLSRRAEPREGGVPGATQRVVLSRRSGGSGPGAAPLAPATGVPSPDEVRDLPPATDAVLWSADWPPALRRYVSTVIERAAADR